MNNTPQIETIHLILRPLMIDDAPHFFQYRSDAETNRYQGWIPKCQDDAVMFISKIAKRFNEPESWYQLAIIHNETKELIGDVGIHFFGVENKQVEIGCTLAKKDHGKGYASEALQSVISYLFDKLDKHRITTSIDPNNTRSIGLVERLGFRKEAHFKASLFLHGEWLDDVVYAMLKKEWQ